MFFTSYSSSRSTAMVFMLFFVPDKEVGDYPSNRFFSLSEKKKCSMAANQKEIAWATNQIPSDYSHLAFLYFASDTRRNTQSEELPGFRGVLGKFHNSTLKFLR